MRNKHSARHFKRIFGALENASRKEGGMSSRDMFASFGNYTPGWSQRMRKRVVDAINADEDLLRSMYIDQARVPNPVPKISARDVKRAIKWATRKASGEVAEDVTEEEEVAEDAAEEEAAEDATAEEVAEDAAAEEVAEDATADVAEQEVAVVENRTVRAPMADVKTYILQRRAELAAELKMLDAVEAAEAEIAAAEAAVSEATARAAAMRARLLGVMTFAVNGP